MARAVYSTSFYRAVLTGSSSTVNAYTVPASHVAVLKSVWMNPVLSGTFVLVLVNASVSLGTFFSAGAGVPTIIKPDVVLRPGDTLDLYANTGVQWSILLSGYLLTE